MQISVSRDFGELPLFFAMAHDGSAISRWGWTRNHALKRLEKAWKKHHRKPTFDSFEMLDVNWDKENSH